MNLTPIFESIIALVGIIITSIAIPFAKSKLSDQHLKMLTVAVNVAVQAAEQLYKGQSGVGNLKKAHVIKALCEQGYIIDDKITDKINNLIESAVYSLTN